MPILEIEEFERAAREDPEFTREIRYFDGQIELTAGEETYLLAITDGALVHAHAGTADPAELRISVGGPAELWEAMLEDKPKPFHHSLQSCAVKHGLLISDNNETYAYLPALNRMMSILRAVHNQES